MGSNFYRRAPPLPLPPWTSDFLSLSSRFHGASASLKDFTFGDRGSRSCGTPLALLSEALVCSTFGESQFHLAQRGRQSSFFFLKSSILDISFASFHIFIDSEAFWLRFSSLRQPAFPGRPRARRALCGKQSKTRMTSTVVIF